MNQTVEKERLRRRKQNQRRARTKRFFMVLGVLIVVVDIYRSRKEGRHGRTKTGQLSS